VFAILAGGAPFQLERLESRSGDAGAARHESLYLDTASYGPRALELATASVGAESLVYGSDTPVIDPRPTLRSVLGFGQAVTDAICRDNPTKLLG
jgi:predicted TIM-barrel fold metal-dependent hydrolase